MTSASFPSVAYYARNPHAPAPAGHPLASACWLIARHPVLAQLAGRVPGVVNRAGDVRVSQLAAAIRLLDEHTVAWKGYPAPTAGVDALAVMSRTELARLRLLATFDERPAALCVPDLDGFDDAGRDLVLDWMVAVLAFHGNPLLAGTVTDAIRAYRGY